MLDTSRIAAFIAAKRHSLGLTQTDMAERLGVSFQSVSKWENGTLPNVEYLIALAALFDLTVDEILAGPVTKSAVFVSWDARFASVAGSTGGHDSDMTEKGAVAVFFILRQPLLCS